MDTYNPKDYETALNEWRPLAEQGNADAQFCLGVMYQRGHGVPQDYQQAQHWYEKAAVQGHVGAQFNLGLLYQNGEGVPQDFVQAYKWAIMTDLTPTVDIGMLSPSTNWRGPNDVISGNFIQGRERQGSRLAQRTCRRQSHCLCCLQAKQVGNGGSLSGSNNISSRRIILGWSSVSNSNDCLQKLWAYRVSKRCSDGSYSTKEENRCGRRIQREGGYRWLLILQKLNPSIQHLISQSIPPYQITFLGIISLMRSWKCLVG